MKKGNIDIILLLLLLVRIEYIRSLQDKWDKETFK